ncbi:glycosyltransferase family 4 protein [Vibrio quintilis]|uniref:UDP-D-galactose:(Glucosyl)lipopolysaccharide-1, 6-D-galactosyltransferase n=1 Tax=Vibrio quintilis TaxID=1117707 RepID=A0A1M7YR22_9VIBR|nr:glycosyltransferase family 4 protein [Vibrio quintilis]SHO55071.1 UDP-D-galactose:(glucosyl)lipopolysaccharide-1, 6-D-galactosyltransferase [Vibrio quintilis]
MNLFQRNEIWLVLDSRIFGGIESHVLQLACGLKIHRPVRIILLKTYPDSDEMAEKLRQHEIPFTILSEYFPHHKTAAALKQAIHRFRPAVVHAHGYKASLLCKLARRTSKESFRQISTFHAGEIPTGRVKWYDLLDRITAFMSDQSLAVSQLIQQRIPFRTEKVNNFVDTEQLPLSDGKQIAFVGRLSYEKGPDFLPEITRLLPETNIHCYGDGPMLSQLSCSGQHNLILHGHKSCMDTFWPDIGLLIICSRAEGLPMAALEAMGRGIPVAATAVGELPELIRHGENGYLVRQAQELVSCIQDWCHLSATERRQMQTQARETIVSHYSNLTMIPDMMKKYFV